MAMDPEISNDDRPLDRSAVRGAVAEFPERLALAIRRVAVGAIPDGEWSPAEILRHLIAVEDEVWHARLRQLAAEDGPRWASTEPDRWLKRPDAELVDLHAVMAARRSETVAMVDRLDDAGWARSGIHERYGVLDVAGLLALMIDHDEEHLASLD